MKKKALYFKKKLCINFGVSQEFVILQTYFVCAGKVNITVQRVHKLEVLSF